VCDSQAAFGPPFFRPPPRYTAPVKRIREILVAAAALGGSLCLSGCGTLRAYEGERLSADDYAVVRGDPSVSAGLPVQVILRKVDDYDVPVSKTAVELKPGSHSFLVDCRVPEAGSVTRFAITAEVMPGGRYRLIADTNARGCLGVELQ
jgi:uncharacterized lipoprotein